MTLRCHIGVHCTGYKIHCDKLPTSHLLLMAGQVFEQIELQAKLLNYFLGSNKSNINQIRHHSRPHAGSLSTTRSSDLREMICALTAEQEWLVRRGPGIGSHTGRRVRDGHLKGPDPNRT